MELEIFANFQRDLIELSVFNGFQSVQQIAKKLSAAKNAVASVHNNNKIRKINVKRFNPLHDLTERDFRYRYRYSKESMRHLIEMLKDDLEVEVRNGELLREQVPVDKQIMAAIRYWGQTEHCKLTARVHGVSLRTLMKISKRVAEALAAQASRYIRMPCLLVEKEKVTKDFYNLAHMPQVIGAVAHSKIKCNFAQPLGVDISLRGNVENMFIQIVSDANLKIRDIDCRLLAVQDDQMTHFNTKTAWNFFLQTRIRERFEQNEFRGRILIGDSSLQCTNFLYTPVVNAITRSEQIFNHALKLTYDIVHQCINLWQQRFGILKTELTATGSTARHIIIGLALLHNMAIEWKDPALDDFKKSLFGLNIEQKRLNDNRSRTEFIKNNFRNPNINYFP